MRKRVLLISIVALMTALAFGAYPGNRTESKRVSSVAATSAPPLALTPPCSEDIADISECPITGCGEGGDSNLNSAKNRSDAPSSPSLMTIAQNPAQLQPLRWTTGAVRSSMRGSGKEGTAVIVKGYLLKVKAEGKESCNCGLGRRADTDVHFAVVSKLPDAETPSAVEASEMGSVTAEITPRVRGDNEKWLFKNINDLEGEYVRLSGWLMLDTKHLPPNRPVKRATNWEVHPVTKVEVCTKSKRACDAGSGWKDF
jgi:hypothetical protein